MTSALLLALQHNQHAPLTLDQVLQGLGQQKLNQVAGLQAKKTVESVVCVDVGQFSCTCEANTSADISGAVRAGNGIKLKKWQGTMTRNSQKISQVVLRSFE